MIPAAVIYSVIFVWCSIIFFDVLLQSCGNFPYLWFLNKTGLIISIGQLKWTTSKFNRLFYRWSRSYPSFLNKWFTLGAIITPLCIIPAICVMITTAWKQLMKERGQEGDPVLQAVFPGVNLPFSEVTYYILTLLVCSVIHEAGHAIAAIREDVKIYGFGFLVLIVFPAAFVDLPTEQMIALTSWQQLKVYCAGVWNNVVLTVMALVTMLLLPVISLPLFLQGGGVTTVSISSHSPLLGARGIGLNEVITGINHCEIRDFTTWYQCISETITIPPKGLCLEEGIVRDMQEPKDLARMNTSVPMDCCLPTSLAGLCYSYISKIHGKEEHVCLPARQLLDRATVYCDNYDHCAERHSEAAVCLRHVGESTSRLLQIHRRSQDDVLFIGDPADLYHTVTVTNYSPRTKTFSSFIPYAIETFCRYVVAFSSALALINVLPCHMLDGQLILKSLVEFAFSSCIPNYETRKRLTSIIMIFGSFLLAINLFLGMRSLLL